MKTVTCLMFACVLMASTAQAQAPAPAAAGAGQKVPLSEGLRRSYNTLKMNLTEAAQKFDEASYSYNPSPDILRLRRALAHVANSHSTLARLRRESESPSGSEPRKIEERRGPTSFRRSRTRSRFAMRHLRI